MKEKYVVSLETAKRLKELGFPQQTDFYRVPQKNTQRVFTQKDFEEGWIDPEYEKIAAPHVGELGEWLDIGGYEEGYSVAFTMIELSGKKVFIEGKGIMQSFQAGDSKPEARKYICSFNNWGRKKKLDGEDIPDEVHFDANTEAEARAKMLIYLAENGLLDPKTLIPPAV